MCDSKIIYRNFDIPIVTDQEILKNSERFTLLPQDIPFGFHGTVSDQSGNLMGDTERTRKYFEKRFKQFTKTPHSLG